MKGSAFILACFSLTISSPLPAQSETPEVVAQLYVSAMRQGDWQGMSRLMHPEALRQLRILLGPMLEAPEAEELREAVLGLRTAADARALGDTALFAGFLKAVAGQSPELERVLKGARTEIIGKVSEGADTVHVLMRVTLTVEGIQVSQMDIWTACRYGNTWRGMLKGDMAALAAALKKTVGT
jgi:hypothetical protein